MVISVRLNEKEEKLFRTFAKEKSISLSNLFRNSVLEKIENEYDLELYYESLKMFEEDNTTYSHDEVCKILNINNV